MMNRDIDSIFQIIFHVRMKYPQLHMIPLLITLSLITLSSCSPTQCPLTTDQPIKQTLTQFPIPCLQKALRNGWTNVIDHLVKQRQQQHKQKFITLLQQQLKRLEILEEDIVLGTSETQPILKWGQNRTHVFITFKLSHRWDSPPCLYTQAQQSRLETDAFFYNNVCVVSHQKVNFKVNLNLFRSVMLSMKDKAKGENSQQREGQRSNEEQSSQQNSSTKADSPTNPNSNFPQYQFDVKKDGVGQYSTILLKKVPQIWIFLTKQQKSYPTWHQISERFPDEFREYEQSLSTHRFVQRQAEIKQAASRAPVNNASSLLDILRKWWNRLWQ